MKRAVKIFLAVIFSFAFTIQAQEPKQPPSKSGQEIEVVVKEREVREKAPDQLQVEDKSPMLKNRVVDYLEELPGVDLYRTGLSGTRNSLLRLRGMDESRVLIMMEDTPLNGSGVYGGYYVDWASLNLDNLEEIELIRGGHSARYGNNLGGVLILKLKKPSEELKSQLRASISSFNTQRYQVNHSGGIKPVYWNIAGSYYQTDGYLRNNDQLTRNYQLDLYFQLSSRTWLALHGKYTTNEIGFIMKNDPNSADYDPSYPESLEEVLGGPYLPFKGGDFYWGQRSHWEDTRQNYWLDFEHQFSSLKLKSSFSWKEQERWEYFYAKTNPELLILKRYSEPEQNTWSGWLGVEEHKLGKHQLNYGIQAMNWGYGGIEVKKAELSYFWFPPYDSPSRYNAQRLYAGYLEDDWQAQDWLKVRLGIRYDDFYGDYEDVSGDNLSLNGFSPKLGLIFYPWQDGEVGVWVSKAYRFPTCPESYWYFAGYQPPEREELKPEQAMLYELSISQGFSRVQLELRGYYYEVQDYIRTIFGYRPSRVVYNIDRVNLGGLEFFVSGDLESGLSFFAHYSYQDNKKSGDILDKSSELSERLVELPRNKAMVGLEYQAKNQSFVRVKGKWIDQREQIVGNLAWEGASSLKELDSVVLVSVEAGYQFFQSRSGLKGKIFAEINNLTDQKYEEIWGYPMPGRTYGMGLEVEF